MCTEPCWNEGNFDKYTFSPQAQWGSSCFPLLSTRGPFSVTGSILPSPRHPLTIHHSLNRCSPSLMWCSCFSFPFPSPCLTPLTLLTYAFYVLSTMFFFPPFCFTLLYLPIFIIMFLPLLCLLPSFLSPLLPSLYLHTYLLLLLLTLP